MKRQLGISYNAAWRMKHKLLQVMKECHDSKPLCGIVQLDDADWGGERRGGKRGRGAAGKTPFVAAVQTDQNGYRFNRRFKLEDMIPCLGQAAVRTPPMPQRLLKRLPGYVMVAILLSQLRVVGTVFRDDDVCTRDGVLRFLKHTPALLRASENPVESLRTILESTAAIKLGY
jgi:hypothetical protein